MKIFGKSDETSTQNGSFWSRIKKQKKQDKKCTAADTASTNAHTPVPTATKSSGSSSHHQQKLQQVDKSSNISARGSRSSRPPQIRVSDDGSLLTSSTPSKKDSTNFRLSLQSLRNKPQQNLPFEVGLPFQTGGQFLSHLTGGSGSGGGSGSSGGHRSGAVSAEQLDSRLRTSKLQCEQLKKKVATISLEYQRLENQCRELKEIKDQVESFQSDLLMLKRKDKISAEIQLRINYLEEENFQMRQQIDKLRSKVKEIGLQLDPEIINKRLDSLESESNQMMSITIQNRRNHEAFSLDVGNQLVETFITQQTIYEEFRRLQHRLVSVERQNQIMADLIHLHCHSGGGGSNGGGGVSDGRSGSNPRPSSGGGFIHGNAVFMTSSAALSHQDQLSLLSFSPPSSSTNTTNDQDVASDKPDNTSPQNIEWNSSEYPDCVVYQSSSLNKQIRSYGIPGVGEYYKIDFSPYTDSVSTLQRPDSRHCTPPPPLPPLPPPPTQSFSRTPVETSANTAHTVAMAPSGNVPTSTGGQQHSLPRLPGGIDSPVSSQRDDGYYSASTNRTMMASCCEESCCRQRAAAPSIQYRDKKERYLILPRRPQKSHGRSLCRLPTSESSKPLLVALSRDLETSLSCRRLRQRQHQQRDSSSGTIPTQTTTGGAFEDNEDDLGWCRVFSDTELHGTRFCIDSDLDEEDEAIECWRRWRPTPLSLPPTSVAASSPTSTVTCQASGIAAAEQRKFGFFSPSRKIQETRLLSALPPLIENSTSVGNVGERRIQIRSSVPGPGRRAVSGHNSRLVPPKVRPRSMTAVGVMETVSVDGSPCNTGSPSDHRKQSPQAYHHHHHSNVHHHKNRQRSPQQQNQLPPFSQIPTQRRITAQSRLPPPVPPRPRQRNQATGAGARVMRSGEGCTDCCRAAAMGSLEDPLSAEYFNDPHQSQHGHHPSVDHNLQGEDEYARDNEDDEDDGEEEEEEDPYYDQEFVSQLDEYQLPNSCLNTLVMQHFK